MTTLAPRLTLLALLCAPILALTACGGGDDASAAPALSSQIDVGSGIPEDIVASGSTAYVSNLADGSILKIDLAQGGATSRFLGAAQDAYSSGWGLRVVPSRNWLLAIHNQPYDFNPAHAQAGRVHAYDLTTGQRVKQWDLPAQAVGNSVDVDLEGNIYVGDIGPLTRILKIDPATDRVSVWRTDSRWQLDGFGIGGMVFSGTGLYASHNNVLWYIGIAADGSAQTPAPVQVAGDPTVFADGMAWSEGGIDYAENDLFTPGAHGAVYRLTFSDPLNATRTAVREGLFDPSGVASATVSGRQYLLVNESRLGYAVGTEAGVPSGPYQVQLVAR